MLSMKQNHFLSKRNIETDEEPINYPNTLSCWKIK